jgi:cold shock CspA family protein
VEFKGKLVRWNDDRGFGFIKVLSGEEDIFIHITALKDMPRRPVVGDIIYFQVEHGEDGKTRAKSARIEGLAKIPRKTGAKKNGNWYVFVFVFLVIILIAFLSYYMFFSSIFEEEDFTGYKCEGKQYCSQMTCKEARFYLKNCPNVEIDGDFDGIPCEQQCR